MAYDSSLLSRPDWAGASKDVDIHIEEHTGIVDKSFVYTSKLAPYMNIRTLRGSNTLRIDRLGAAQVKGRRAGEALVDTAIAQEKFNLTVDTTLYMRHRIDLFDDWTANRDMRREYAQEDGIGLAKQFDQACLIAALKAPEFVPPSSLSGSFSSGVLEVAAVTDAVSEDNADLIVRAHRASLEALINRDLGDRLYSEGVSFVTPRVFSILLEHARVTNVDYGAGDNSFVKGRIGIVNGVRVVETPRVPAAAITDNALGDAFNVTALQAKRGIITLIPSLSLVTAQVHALQAKMWDDPENFATVLDTFQSYNIGVRRPDSIAVVQIGASE